ncbi:hypothetical protein K1X76_10050 [bacterium]|nr:hypothetical protein [bacterium]
MLTGLNDYLKEATAKKHVVGSWGFNAGRDFSKASPEETNVWFFEQVFNFLRSFFGLVLPDNMEVITYNATQHIKKENLEQQTFLDELMLIMKNLKEPLWTLRLNLNLVGFIRTHHDPDMVRRVQIKEPSSFIVWGGPDETGFETFSISYTLFNESFMEGTDEMLWSVNQPLLEKALKKWERQTGRVIDVVEANNPKVPMSRSGFKRPLRPAGARPPQGIPQRGAPMGSPQAQGPAREPVGARPRAPMPPPGAAPRPQAPRGMPVPPPRPAAPPPGPPKNLPNIADVLGGPRPQTPPRPAGPAPQTAPRPAAPKPATNLPNIADVLGGPNKK